MLDYNFFIANPKSELIQKNGYLHTSYIIIQLLNGHNMQITTVLHLHIVYVQYIHVFSFSNHILRQIIWWSAPWNAISTTTVKLK